MDYIPTSYEFKHKTIGGIHIVIYNQWFFIAEERVQPSEDTTVRSHILVQQKADVLPEPLKFRTFNDEPRTTGLRTIGPSKTNQRRLALAPLLSDNPADHISGSSIINRQDILPDKNFQRQDSSLRKRRNKLHLMWEVNIIRLCWIVICIIYNIGYYH